MKILIWGIIKNGGPFDVFRDIDYQSVYSEFLNNYHANSTNVGNKVWIQGIISCLSTEQNQLFFLREHESWEHINTNYDAIIYSAANLLSEEYQNEIKNITSIFKNSKIPIYVIAVGAQANKYSDIDRLVNSIGADVSAFVETIYASGGEIACRGYFTKELIDKVTRNTAVVTGCPSVFQNGRQLIIKKRNEKLHPAFNGALIKEKELYYEYPDSIFFDQDQWIQENYDLSLYSKSTSSFLRMLIEKHGVFYTDLFLQDRIKVFFDIPHWRNYLIDEGINFSCGTRIHGNIISILSGIPAVVLVCDTRTRELAEFFEIPMIEYANKNQSKRIDINNLYERIDFDHFNKSFQAKFDLFERFLVNCNLVKQVNQNNIFWKRQNPSNVFFADDKKKKAMRLLKRVNLLGEFGWRIFYKSTNHCLSENVLKQPMFNKEEYEQNLFAEKYK